MTRLKILLTATLLAFLAGASAAQETPAQDAVIIQANEVKLGAYPGDPGKWGMKAAIVYGDPTKSDFYAERLSYPKNVMSTPHSHTADRVVLVLSGTWYQGLGTELDPKKAVAVHAGGTVIQPKGQMHFDGSLGDEAVVQIVTLGRSGVVRAHPGEASFVKIAD